MSLSTRNTLMSGSIVRLVTASACVLALVAAWLLFAAPASADRVAPVMKGREQIKVNGVFSKSSKLRSSMILSGDTFTLHLDDETWTGRMVGSGENIQFSMTDAQFDAIEAHIASDLRQKHGKKFVTSAQKARLEKLIADQKDAYESHDAIRATYSQVERRLNDLRSGGGPVPFDLLRDLQNELAALETRMNEARAEAIDLGVGIDVQRQLMNPQFDVTVTSIYIKYKLNGKRTKGKLTAKIDYSAQNLVDRKFYEGKRTVKAKGKILNLD